MIRCALIDVPSGRLARASSVAVTHHINVFRLMENDVSLQDDSREKPSGVSLQLPLHLTNTTAETGKDVQQKVPGQSQISTF